VPLRIFALERAKANRLPVMPRVLITVPEKTAQPYRFSLDRKIVSIGRGSENDIVIDSGSVSGKHAEMHRVEGGYELADLGSTNGIKCDGFRQQKVALRSGMMVKLGDVAFEFTLSGEELEAIGHERPMLPPILKEAEVEAPAQNEKAGGEPVPSPPRQVVVRQSAGAGFVMVFLFLVLAAGCFFAGLAIRHQKDTGEPLIKAIVNKGETKEEAPAPPAVEE